MSIVRFSVQNFLEHRFCGGKKLSNNILLIINLATILFSNGESPNSFMYKECSSDVQDNCALILSVCCFAKCFLNPYQEAQFTLFPTVSILICLASHPSEQYCVVGQNVSLTKCLNTKIYGYIQDWVGDGDSKTFLYHNFLSSIVN